MVIKSIVKVYRNMVREIEADKILDKISKNKPLTQREIKFLESYHQSDIDEDRDLMYISKNLAFVKITKLLDNNKKIICNLRDRNGKFGSEILKIQNNFEDDCCIITMKTGEKHKLQDKFLYNLIYNTGKDEYSLEEQGEYFEKLKVSSD